MKRYIVHIILVLIIATGETGCKRGENDPFFSIRSRANRLTGTWNLEEATWVVNDTTYNYDGENLVTTSVGITSDPLPLTIAWELQRNGDYSITKVYNYPANYNGTGNASYTYNVEKSGVWNFAGGEGTEPKKSELLLIEDYSQEALNTASNINAVEIDGANEGVLYDIDELRYQKLVLKYDKTTNTPSGSVHESADLTFERE